MSRLDPFQQEVLEAFFEREQGFFLTGGGALAGFYLKHRTTKDLDFFTVENRMEQRTAALQATAEALGASIEGLATHPDFRRFLLKRGPSSVVVELVRDRTPQLFEKKANLGGIRVDPLEEIVANKLCTLLSRAEIRDLVDLKALEEAGFRVEQHLDRAALKDGGLTPGQLSWVISQIEIGDDARLPAEVTVAELSTFLTELEKRLATMSTLPRR